MRKRIWAFLVSICLVNLLIFSTAAAAEHPDIQKGIPMSRKEISVVHYGKNQISSVKSWGNAYELCMDQIPVSAKDIKVKSSNTKVVSVKKADRRSWCVPITAKKAGQATIKVTAVYKGKTISQSSKVKVIAYKNPAEEIKIGTKNYAGQFRDTAGKSSAAIAKGKYTVSCKAAKGWTLKEICLFSETDTLKTPDSESGDLEMVTTVKLKKIKNNTKIYLNETKELQLVFYHKASKIEQSLVIDVK